MRTRHWCTLGSMQLFQAGLVFGFFLELTGPNSPLFTLARAEGTRPPS